jgi:hypothetical protein
MMLGQHGAKKKTKQRAAKDARKNNHSNHYCTHDSKPFAFLIAIINELPHSKLTAYQNITDENLSQRRHPRIS